MANFFWVVLPLLVSFNQNNTNVEFSFIENSNELQSSSAFIVMEDLMTRANTGQDNNIITLFEVFDVEAENLVFSTIGCGETECLFDLGHLSPATYYAKATTENGYTFDDFIVIE